jgi:hypothetical protein
MLASVVALSNGLRVMPSRVGPAGTDDNGDIDDNDIVENMKQPLEGLSNSDR